MSIRKVAFERKTKETDITLKWNLDGEGQVVVSTGIPFFDHMLLLFGVHGLFDFELAALGDIDVDFHHTVEDVGICMGKAFREAINEGKGIARYASGFTPMDEALCYVAVDISGRPYFEWNRDFLGAKQTPFDAEMAEVFFQAFVDNAKITLHINMLRGKNLHHMLEACFKGLGMIMDKASIIDSRKNNVIPSTKGVLLE
jgi:imidazoleglycerol-phosphate dehydratase